MTLVTGSKLSARQVSQPQDLKRTLLFIFRLFFIYTRESCYPPGYNSQITQCESFTVTLHEVHTSDASLTQGSSAAFPWAEREF